MIKKLIMRRIRQYVFSHSPYDDWGTPERIAAMKDVAEFIYSGRVPSQKVK